MKSGRACVGVFLALAVSCGANEGMGPTDAGTDAGSDAGTDGGSDGGTKDLGNFLGAAWNALLTTTVSCPGALPLTSTDQVLIVFSPGSGADLQYTSPIGCTYQFNVSGNTASLSNAPVTCSTLFGAVPVTLTWTSYTATTSDGHNLNLMSAGTASLSGQVCSFSITGSATR
jgi:hypothetical protein